MKNWRIPDHFIPEGDVWLGEPEPLEFRCEFINVVDLPVPRGFDNWGQYVDAGCPYHPYQDLPGEPDPSEGIPERVYRENREWWDPNHPRYRGERP